MFCGSATWRRWKSAPAGNSSVSVSSARPVGVASVSRLATGIEALANGVEDAPVPGVRDLLELDLRRLGRQRSAGGGRGTARLLVSGSEAAAGAGVSRRAGRHATRAARRDARATRARDPRRGRVTFTSASSSGSRGSAPWRMSSTATASRSMSRSTVGSRKLVRLLAQALASSPR